MEHLDKKTKITIMIAVMSALLFSALNMTIVGTSLPKIIASIGGMDYYSWVFTVYMLTASITSILVGKLSDIYGRKVFILIGIAVFMVGGLLSGFSQTIIQLIIFRGIQGFGGGMIMSSAFTTIGDLFSPRERGRWQGLMGAVFGLSSLFGPTLGGFIVDNMDWSWVFWIFLPIGFFAFFMIYKLYPQAERREKEKIDFLGSFVLSITILSLLLGFSLAGNDYSWGSFQVIGLFAIFFGSLILFIIIENRVESPVVPLGLFKNSIVSVSNIASFLSGAGMFGVIMYVPFYIQGVLGRSATLSGLTEMAMTTSMVMISAVAGQLITKTGKYKLMGLVGFATLSLGLFLNSLLTPESSLLTMVFNLVICGIGLGLTMPIFTLTVQNAVEHKYLGVATATSQLSRQMGGTVGVAILGATLNSRMSAELERAKLPPELVNGSLEGASDLQNPSLLMDPHAIEAIQSQLPEQMQPMFEQLLLVLQNALNASLTGVFFFASMTVALAFIVTLFLKEIPLRESNEPTIVKEQE
ncbi:MDR family MFS transporter [Alkalihalobacillus deserti]|uniref:MDR family MFS transporter n=1 Tax=Alkalihalobacillus deserti TaxID=2879466 RepID=UPI001D14965F|nr:MDR family MFS transporter [Alkalihalobacillus deserti]